MVRKEKVDSKLQKFFSFFFMGLLPALAEACPRCVDATPYKAGMQLAVVVLLPVPFALAYGLYHFIKNEANSVSIEK